MLSKDQLDALSDAAEWIAGPINEYLIADIARRVAGAAQLTSTAAYEVYRAQQLGLSRKEIEAKLQALLKVDKQQLKKLLTQSAEVGYNFDLANLPTYAVPFANNTTVQQIVSAAVELAQDDFTNITQTIGMIDRTGQAMPLQQAYRSAMDSAFEQVSTGAADYMTAIRRATKDLAAAGVQVIDYESGVHTSLEAAVRRSVMGGVGLMTEQIAQVNHDTMSATGWEISAHAASAPDHEPIQGRQYSDDEYETLNNSLERRIGTLNCGHVAFPIIYGVTKPQYTEEQLRQFREDNEKGITFEGKHYTMYEATQFQRRLERGIRRQKRIAVAAEAGGDKDKLLTAQIRVQTQRQNYLRFSKAAGLRTQQERLDVAGFGRKESAAARSAYTVIAKQANSMYDIGNADENINAYLRDKSLRDKLQSDQIISIIETGQQRKHIPGTLEYNQYVSKLSEQNWYGPSRLGITMTEAQTLVDRYRGTGILPRRKDGTWDSTEIITTHPDTIGIVVDNLTGAEAETAVFKIHYRKSGTHIVPDYPSKKGAKGRQ